jgi:hypothetical protein
VIFITTNEYITSYYYTLSDVGNLGQAGVIAGFLSVDNLRSLIYNALRMRISL